MLKIFDAVEEVMKMDDLQLIQARKHFKWAYLRSALDELRLYLEKHGCICKEGFYVPNPDCPVHGEEKK